MLAETFPACFDVRPRKRRPLKLGINAEVLSIVAGAITPHELRLALLRYTSSHWYLRGIIAGATRIGLDGKPAGVVTEKDELYVRARLQRRGIELGPSPASRRGASLADLRAAHRTRRGAP